jgi:para-nitrobenzyl esterase
MVVVAAATGCVATSSERPSRGTCLAATSAGSVQGLDRGSSCAFTGIPFAAPPSGELRWKPPQPARTWAPATLDATRESAACPFGGAGATARGSEDCLTLNIWTPNPSPAAPAPVIVWFHAGAFVAGSASMPASNGQRLAEQTGAIVVAPNYRLGPFGFLAHRALTAENPAHPSSGNYGLLDQRAALSWVRDHIAAFAGNPDSVTIAGQSAGAHSVSLHLISPEGSRTFHRAIMQSGFASTRWRTLAEAEADGDAFAAAVGCGAGTLSCLRSKTRDQVLLALPSGPQQFAETARMSWGPVVDGVTIPDQPRRLYEKGAFLRVPIIVGTTRDEAWDYVDRSFPAGLSPAVYNATVEGEFGLDEAAAILRMYPDGDFASPKQALARLTSDVEAVCEARRVARLVERTGTPVYVYSFEREPATGSPGVVVHGRDTNFVFGNNFDRQPYVLNTTDRLLSDAMSAFWTNFAAIGDPNGGRRTPIAWSRYTRHREEDGAPFTHLVLNWPLQEGRHLREKECDFWLPSFLRSVVGSVPASHP